MKSRNEQKEMQGKIKIERLSQLRNTNKILWANPLKTQGNTNELLTVFQSEFLLFHSLVITYRGFFRRSLDMKSLACLLISEKYSSSNS